MNICIVGAGYVGITTAAVLSELGHIVYCTDRIASKIARLNKGEIPIYEPGLEELVARGIQNGTLFFDTEVRAHMAACPIVMIAVGTPPRRDGSADMSYLDSVVADLAASIKSHTIVIVKSTVPPGQSDWIESRLHEAGVPEQWVDVVSNPEFLREGTALQDSIHPDRIVIGAKREQASRVVKEMYRSIESEYVLTERIDAEMIKYVSNAFLAIKISFINEIARVCEAFGADVTTVAKGVGLDQRIGPRFLQAGLGYGGSCLPKDINALSYVAGTKGVKLKMLHAARTINRTQLDVYLHKLKQALDGNDQPTIAVWGATFKENTDDTRFSQAIAFMKKLVRQGWKVKAYDPLVSPPIRGVSWSQHPYEAIVGADALVLATGWDELIHADWASVSEQMKGNVVLDGRNLLDSTLLEAAGLRYVGVGRS
ncbi:UDP-glucose dehydrogenase family protein [Paenibacillus herberti]|uniref:UDP-glucose 6-dehydrogenase n=1 Tax=Paenibacillus herberti TaxID=1619309 RepID=A0A229P532_9BACL|nr:UDP-glucose/GDP-mannose dehydrogenase family protein [Paenibacillus herberti]OXM17161.1 UDP-glucose 6-dehydrogenase [Paenibacillus herberti]